LTKVPVFATKLQMVFVEPTMKPAYRGGVRNLLAGALQNTGKADGTRSPAED
jgi:hypothetical protein